MNEILNQLKHYFNTTPREVIEEEWNALGKEFGDVGPKVDEFLLLLEETIKWDFEVHNNQQIIQTTPNYYNSEFFFIFANNITQQFPS